MSYTLELIDAAKKAKGITSDYRLAQVLGVSRSTPSHWRVGRAFPDYSSTCTLADWAGIERGAALLGVGVDRMARPEKREIVRQVGAEIRARALAHDGQ